MKVLFNIQHRSTIIKNNIATNTYLVTDTIDKKDVVVSMPLHICICGVSLYVAIYQYFSPRGRETVAQALNDYWQIRAVDGCDIVAARKKEVEWLRETISLDFNDPNSYYRMIHKRVERILNVYSHL